MTKARKRRGLGVALILAAAAALAMATPTVASATPSVSATSANPPCTISANQVISSARTQGIGGVIVAAGTSSSCQDPPPPPEPAFNGTPPLLFHGSPPTSNCFFSPCEDGNVMMTRETGPLIITPIFWDPPGHPMSFAYKAIITSYLADVAEASGRDTNVFSVLNEYYGNNGQIHYNIDLTFPVNDTNPLPANGCTLEAVDTSKIYADGSGYNACLDDDQLQAEVNSVTAQHGLAHNLSHIYVLYLPKQVESCFLPGETTDPSDGQACTINYEPTAAYCAYHSEDPANAVYANLAYPIYNSPVGFTCGSDARFPVVESPNGNPDADTEVSATSHEVSEAITDPDVQTGWYDSTGNEIGDDCAYIYGATNGQPGRLYNQTIFGQHFLTQQEFSNRVFNASGGKAGCVDSQRAES
jgi:type II secretory pathway pseudopilin PulG